MSWKQPKASWEKQPRDSKGRFIKATPVATPPVSRRTRKPKIDNRQICVFLLDDTGSIRHNDLTDVLESGLNESVDAVAAASKTNKVETYYGFSLFGTSSSKHFQFGNVAPVITNYNPRQRSTALYDAIGYGIRQVDLYNKKLNIPTKNIQFTIFTDGDENDSREFNRYSIKQLIEEKIAEGWSINFMGGGNADSVMKAAENMGIYAANTVSFQNNTEEVKEAMKKYRGSTQSYTASVAKGQSSNIGFFSK